MIINASVASLGLAVKTQNALYRCGIDRIGQLTELTPTELLSVPGIGTKAYAAILDALDECGLSLAKETV